jgi:hypothetical protein
LEKAMTRDDWKSLWDELRRTLHGWMDDEDEGEKAQDPTFTFHLLFTAPLVLGILAMMARRA